MATWEIPKELGSFYVVSLIVPFYIQWYQFITVQVTLTILSNWETLNVMLVLKMLRLNLFNIGILWNLNAILQG